MSGITPPRTNDTEYINGVGVGGSGAGGNGGNGLVVITWGNNTSTCPSGYTQQGNLCLQDNTCPSGYQLQGNVCMPISTPNVC